MFIEGAGHGSRQSHDDDQDGQVHRIEFAHRSVPRLAVAGPGSAQPRLELGPRPSLVRESHSRSGGIPLSAPVLAPIQSKERSPAFAPIQNGLCG